MYNLFKMLLDRINREIKMMPMNEMPNRLDALRGNAEMAGGPPAMGGTPPPLPPTASPASAPPMEEDRLASLLGGMDDASMMPEEEMIDEGLAVSDVATGLATAAVETSGGDIGMARASLMEALAELDAMEMGELPA